ncbi:MAG: YceI family protein [Leptospiraceae bacterium]|nr:YceI family protein [Leptospiraceae bacterium]
MRLKTIYLSLLLLPGLAIVTNQCQNKNQPDCTYAYNPRFTEIQWTAFKFISRAGVNGSFQEKTASATESAPTAGDVFRNMSFTVNTDSVFTNNPNRDQKIKTAFFGTLANGALISGHVKSIDSANQGKAQIELKLNEQTHLVDFAFESSPEGQFKATGSINVGDWQALPAIAALNKVCEEAHTQDGVSKLWPDVNLQITTKLDSTCK